MSADVPSDLGHQYTLTDTTSNSAALSALPGVPSMSTVVRCQAQRTRKPGQFEKAGSGSTIAPSQSCRRPNGIRGGLKGTYSCNICGKKYSQPQGVRRHQREMHEARLCIYCRDFEWGRPYRLREHLQKWHPDVDPGAALEEATGTRHKETMTMTHLPQERVSSLTLEYDQRSGAGSQIYPLAMSLPAMMQLPPIAQPAVSPLDYDLQLEFAERMVKRSRGIPSN